MPKTDPIPRTGNRLIKTGALVAAGALALSACGGASKESRVTEVRDLACKVVDEIADQTPDGYIDTSTGFVTLEQKDAVNGHGEPTDASITVSLPEGSAQQSPDAVCEVIQGGDVSVAYTNVPDDRKSQNVGWVELNVKGSEATSIAGGIPNQNGFSEYDVATVEKALDVMSSAKSR